jgi:hypothetical protein
MYQLGMHPCKMRFDGSVSLLGGQAQGHHPDSATTDCNHADRSGKAGTALQPAAGSAACAATVRRVDRRDVHRSPLRHGDIVPTADGRKLRGVDREPQINR